MQPMLRIALQAARDAGQIVERAFRDVERVVVERKSPNDFVTAVDRAAERAIVDALKARYPKHRFIGEEFGAHGPKDAEYEWLIDPLDGTTNFIRGIPQFAVSLACRYRGKLEHAVVYDPLKREEYCGSRGEGATLNGRRIRVSGRKALAGSLLATGIPFTAATLRYIDGYQALSKALLGQGTAGIRRPGAAALDLAYLAAGRFDGFWEMNLKPWDIAAGVLLIREAGGLVGDLSGGETYMKNGNLLCGTPKVYQQMLPLVREFLGEEVG
ncbi:MAG: inositol monophosphatase [Cellvibrionales bacterium]|nr:inositol monophosphatase [Cellvibrionales bacterium]